MPLTVSPLTWKRDTPQYPVVVSRCLGGDAPEHLAIWSVAPSLNHRPTVALFCSTTAPASVLLTVHDLAQQWREGETTVIGGFHSPVEQEALTVLLRHPGRIILCPARSIHRMRLKKEWRQAFNEGRLTLLSPFPENVRRPTKETAYQRNRLVGALADKILVAHARSGSGTWQLTKELLRWGKDVYTIAHQANDDLLTLGVQAWKA